MQNFIKLQNVLIDPKKSFQDFRSQLMKSQITQVTYLCLLLNISATIKRPNFNFQQYLQLLINFKNQPGHRSSCINYTGYKDKISILMNACEKSVSSTVYILANHPDIKLHSVDPNGMNAVYYAIRNPDQNQGLKILQILKDSSPLIMETVINNGYSPLFLAVQKFRIKIVDFLLRNDIDPNQKLISNGNTAMHELMKISSRYSLQEVKKMIQTFLRHGFDLSIKNYLQRTVQQYALDLRFNLSQILSEIKFNKNEFKSNSQFCLKSQFGFRSQQSQTQAYSSKLTHTKLNDFCTTNYNFSQRQQSELNQIQNMSISDNKSLFSQAIYKQRHYEERDKEFSVDMNVNQSQNDEELEDLADSQLDELGRKMQCHSHSDSPRQQFQQQHQQDLQKSQQKLNKSTQGNKQIKQQNSDSLSEGSSSETSNTSLVKIQNINYYKIQQDVLEFSQISQQIYLSAWRQIQPFFIKLNQITQSFGLIIQIVGSFATGLWTHLSDIDIALIALNQNYVDFQRLLEKLYGKMKVRMYNMGIKQLSYNKVSKVPSIKIQMDPYLFSSRKIDIMIFHKKNVAMTYVNFIRQSLITYNAITPIYFFLKRICQQFGLHDPFNGGMKSYSIFLMIHSIIKTLQPTNLGQILLKISLYYGFYHQYDYQIQYHKNTQFQNQQYSALRLNIKDPLNIKNNMGGKHTNAYRVKNMFRMIYYGLHRNIQKGTHLQHILQLASLISQ